MGLPKHDQALSKNFLRHWTFSKTIELKKLMTTIDVYRYLYLRYIHWKSQLGLRRHVSSCQSLQVSTSFSDEKKPISRELFFEKLTL